MNGRPLRAARFLCARLEPIRMPEGPAQRLLILGWDAADWLIAQPLLEAGRMPALKRVIDGGIHADLATLEPTLSPLLWTSIATGKTPDRHGILNFLEPDPFGEGVRLSASTSRRTKALWNIATQAQLKVHAVSWYASHPAEPIAGVCVSNLFQDAPPTDRGRPWPLPPGSVHPTSWAGRIASARIRPDEVGAADLLPLIPKLPQLGRDDERVRSLARLVAQAKSVHRATMAILESGEPWDCLMVFHEAIDSIGHLFMQYHPPRMPHVAPRDFELFREVMVGVYRMQDAMLRELLDRAGAETTVLLLSDHGFHSGAARPVTADRSPEERAAIEASWHRPFGVLAMSGPGVVGRGRIEGAGLLDIAPTALHLLGLPVGRDMPGRVLVEAVGPSTIDPVASWDDIDGDAGLHPLDVRQDPYETRSAIDQLIELGYMAALPEDARGRLDLVRRETSFNLAMVHVANGCPDRAVPVLEALVVEQPDQARYVLALGKSLLAALRFDPCVLSMSRWLERHPKDVEARTLLVAALAAAGRKEDAAPHFARLEFDAAGRPDASEALGELAGSLGLWAKASEHLRTAIARDPSAARPHLGLARLALGEQRWEPAAEHALDALDRSRSMAEGHHLLGVALAWLGDTEDAERSLALAIAIQPGLVEARRFLIAIHRARGNESAAAEHEAKIADLLALRGIDREPADQTWGPRAWQVRAATGEKR